MPDRIPPETRFLIACEGKDAKMFLIWYLESQFPGLSKEVYVEDWGGNEQLPDFLADRTRLEKPNVLTEIEQRLEVSTLTPGFRNVKCFLILRDAEGDAEAAVASVRGALKRAGLAVPDGPQQWKQGNPWTAFLLFPTLTQEPEDGTLEDLCLRSLGDQNAKRIVDAADNYLAQVQPVDGFSWPHKNRLYAYLAGTDKYVGSKLGEAAKKNAFDWFSPLYDGLHGIIEEGLQHIRS